MVLILTLLLAVVFRHLNTRLKQMKTASDKAILPIVRGEMDAVAGQILGERRSRVNLSSSETHLERIFEDL